MDFTREPLIESIIVPTDGCKLCVRRSNGTDDGILLDAIELVSVQGNLFYRSNVHKKSVLLPAQDYEVVEVREAKIPIKKPSTSQAKTNNSDDASSKKGSNEGSSRKSESASKKRGSRKGSSRKRSEDKAQADAAKKEETEQEVPPVFSPLLRPPPTLISESISFKKYEEESVTVKADDDIKPVAEETAAVEAEEMAGQVNEIIVEKVDRKPPEEL